MDPIRRGGARLLPNAMLSEPGWVSLGKMDSIIEKIQGIVLKLLSFCSL